MGRVYTTNWGELERIRLLVGKPERDHYKDQDVGGWVILRWILER
jgi:hypothetical protein